MEIFEIIFIILACIILSALISRFIPMVALPLVQIAVGFVAALVVPHLSFVYMDSELFMVLFIAPLLFNEARKANKQQLWRNKWSVLSLAIGLVIATVLIVGFVLNLIVPSIPLAAAFALAAALAPTDAAAVMAMGSSVKLTSRQETQLSGESLINDASGVVSFHFAIAAAVTGAFSLVEAAESFGVLFLGGILFGAVMGLIARYGVLWMQEHGFDDTRVHVVYEVFTPFAVFLAGEFVGVSGILAVVACGLAMAQPQSRIMSSQEAQNVVLSNSVWRVIVFVINGVIFLLLGMELPLAFRPSALGDFSTPEVLGFIALITAMIMLIRFIWVFVMELMPGKNKPNSTMHEKFHATLITTLAGPKGSVTLSIIFTIPLTLANGAEFPQRELLILLTAGVILCTLVIANIALPLLGRADAPEEYDPNECRRATVAVLEATIHELVETIRTTKDRELVPAMRITIASYRTRLAQERYEMDNCGQVISAMERKVLEIQQAKADELVAANPGKYTRLEKAYFAQTLRGIRVSIGYFDQGISIGTKSHSLGGFIAQLIQRFRLWLAPNPIDSTEVAKIYYGACKFEIELEMAARRYLETVIENGNEAEVHAAKALYEEHGAAIESVWGRLCYMQRGELHDGSDKPFSPFATEEGMGSGLDLPENEIHELIDEPEFLEQEAKSFSEQYEMARHYRQMVDSWALTMELEQIQRLFSEGEIDEQAATALRNNVFNMQMALLPSEE